MTLNFNPMPATVMTYSCTKVQGQRARFRRQSGDNRTDGRKDGVTEALMRLVMLNLPRMLSVFVIIYSAQAAVVARVAHDELSGYLIVPVLIFKMKLTRHVEHSY